MWNCNSCDKHFTDRRHLNRHYKTVHQLKLSSPAQRLVCGACSEVFSKNEEFQQHLSSEHDLQTEKIKQLSFQSEADFIKWKRDVEDGSAAKFVVRNSRKGNECRVVYYRCNRDGPVRIRVSPEERKRKLKDQVSCKTGAHCPARITAAVFNSGLVEVTFYSSHFGHQSPHVPLPSPVKKPVAAKLANHIPFDHMDLEGANEEALEIVDILSNMERTVVPVDVTKKVILDEMVSLLQSCHSNEELDVLKEGVKTWKTKIDVLKTQRPQMGSNCPAKVDYGKKIEPQRQFTLKTGGVRKVKRIKKRRASGRSGNEQAMAARRIVAPVIEHLGEFLTLEYDFGAKHSGI